MIEEDQKIEFHFTAKEWAEKSGLPYRAILKATHSGELTAYRPGGGTRGVIYISNRDFNEWRDSIKVLQKIPQRIAAGPYGGVRSTFDLHEYALK